MAAPPQFSDQRQFLAQIAGVSGNWATTSGGGVSLPNSKEYDGGNPTAAVITGVAVVDDKVLTRNYAPSRDAAELATLKATVASGTPFTTTITIKPTDPAYTLTGDPGDTYTGVLTKVEVPSWDATKSGSATPATCSLTFTCTTLT